MQDLVSLRDEPGTQREYETIYIVKPDTEPSQLQGINERLRTLIEGAEGKLITVENWGKRKLAYEIKKQTKGVYLYWHYLANPHLITELERNLRMIDHVVRFLTVKVDENVDPTARPSNVTEETYLQAATTRPDEEDFYLGKASADEAWGLDDDDSDEKNEKDGKETQQTASAEPGEAPSSAAADDGSAQTSEASTETDAEPPDQDSESEPKKEEGNE